MRRALIIALREYRQIVRTRAFLITLIGMPLLIVAVMAATTMTRPPSGEAFVILDRTGRLAPAIERRLELDYQRAVMNRVAAYAEGKPVAATRPWSTPRWYADAEVQAFIETGGAPAAVREIDAAAPPMEEAPAFRPPARRFFRIAPPALADPSPASFHAAMETGLKDDVETAVGPRPLSVAVYIPEDYGQAGGSAQMWTNGRASPELIGQVQGELSRALKLRALTDAGLDAQEARRIEATAAPLVINRPKTSRERVMLRSAAPMAMSYLLLLTLLITGSMMLQGVIEERSNKLIEAVLACVTPGELMHGKLFGICAVGLTIIGAWLGFAALAANGAPPQLAGVLNDAFTAFRSPLLVAAMLFYYLVGYFMISMFFLVVGALSESMQEAQAYLSPLIIVLTVPFSILVPSILQGGDGIIPVVMSWIPVYTPFAMLARLGTGVTTLEILGTGALLLAFTVLQFMFLGRIFRANLLRSGQTKPSALFRMMSSRTAD